MGHHYVTHWIREDATPRYGACGIQIKWLNQDYTERPRFVSCKKCLAILEREGVLPEKEYKLTITVKESTKEQIDDFTKHFNLSLDEAVVRAFSEWQRSLWLEFIHTQAAQIKLRETSLSEQTA